MSFNIRNIFFNTLNILQNDNCLVTKQVSEFTSVSSHNTICAVCWTDKPISSDQNKNLVKFSFSQKPDRSNT